MLIYKATNIKTGKSYIGQTRRSLETRKIQHFQKSFHKSKNPKCLFHKSIKKHGVDMFIWEILEDNIHSNEDLHKKEQFYINKENTFYITGNGYNMTKGGDNCGTLCAEVDIELTKKLYVEDGLSLQKVSEIVGYTAETIRKILNENGISTTSTDLESNTELIKKMYIEENKSVREIANKFNCSVTGVRKLLNKNNVDLSIKKIKIDEDLLRHMYETENMLIKDISKYFGCSIDTIWRRLKKIGIDTSINIGKYKK